MKTREWGPRSLRGATVMFASLAVGASVPALLEAQTETVSSGTVTNTNPATPQRVSAAPRPAAVAGYVVVDLTSNSKDETQVVSFPARTVSSSSTNIDCASVQPVPSPPPSPSPSPSPSYAIGDLKRLVECAADASVPIDNRAAAASHVKKVAKEFAKAGTPRLITQKGEIVNVVVIDRAQAFFHKGETTPFLVRGRRPKVTFDEKARQTQFVSDLKSLARVAAGIFGKEAAPITFEIEKVKSVDWVHLSPQSLRLKRATVTVTAEQGKVDTTLQAPAALSDEDAALLVERFQASQVQEIKCADGTPEAAKLKSAPLAVLVCRATGTGHPHLRISAIEGLGTLGDARAASVLSRLSNEGAASGDPRLAGAALAALSQLKAPAPPPPAAPPAEEPAKPKAELLTGPIEHWFLSADVPLNSVQALTFDEDTNQVTLGDEPSTFYLGIDFLLGDIKETNRPFLGNVVLKAMLKASKNPLDSVGVGIGLRGQFFSKWGLDLDALTPFVAWTWTEQDVDVDGVVQRRVGRNSEFRFGVSLNLDQAAKWVGGN